MKSDRNGQAKILTDSEVSNIFGVLNARDKAVFGICLYTGTRISEALSIQIGDIAAGVITIRKEATKGKKRSRSIPISPNLETILNEYLAIVSPSDFLFPGRDGTKPLTTAYADLVLRQACTELGLKGISTHSFRRTALTRLHLAGVPLRTIQKISGHSSLSELSCYLEVSEENIKDAVGLI